jgi:hypothetical protein
MTFAAPCRRLGILVSDVSADTLTGKGADMVEQEAGPPEAAVGGGGHTGAPLEAVRGQRRSLRGALVAVEDALAAPVHHDPSGAQERAWAATLREAVEHLAEVFALHVEVTEGPGGLYEDLLDATPRLDNTVRRFKAEHQAVTAIIDTELSRLSAKLDGGEADLEQSRRRLTRLLGRLVRHRQEGADLIYEAYEVDIGGES